MCLELLKYGNWFVGFMSSICIMFKSFMMRIFCTICLCVYFSFQGWAESDFKESFHLFLLLGQSNMAGYGVVLPEDQRTMEDIYVLRDDVGKWNDFGWIEGRQPIQNRLKTDRFCLAGSFAKAYKEMYPRTSVGIIPMAWGGAPISKMSKGTPFYEEVLKKVRWAKEQGCLKAVLWHQGESDTVNPQDTQLYKERLKTLIENLRTDLNEPNLPFIIGDLAEFYGTSPEHANSDRLERIAQVRKVLKEMSEDLPNVGYVPSIGLESHDSHQVHFNRASYIVLGYRYFDVYWQLMK